MKLITSFGIVLLALSFVSLALAADGPFQVPCPEEIEQRIESTDSGVSYQRIKEAFAIALESLNESEPSERVRRGSLSMRVSGTKSYVSSEWRGFRLRLNDKNKWEFYDVVESHFTYFDGESKWTKTQTDGKPETIKVQVRKPGMTLSIGNPAVGQLGFLAGRWDPFWLTSPFNFQKAEIKDIFGYQCQALMRTVGGVEESFCAFKLPETCKNTQLPFSGVTSLDQKSPLTILGGAVGPIYIDSKTVHLKMGPRGTVFANNAIEQPSWVK
jgi:hypothetical protein